MLHTCGTTLPCKGVCALQAGTQLVVSLLKINLDPRLRGDDVEEAVAMRIIEIGSIFRVRQL